jgi:hypothetical protein
LTYVVDTWSVGSDRSVVKLLIMKDTTQSNCLHSLPKSKNITQPRINVAF